MTIFVRTRVNREIDRSKTKWRPTDCKDVGNRFPNLKKVRDDERNEIDTSNFTKHIASLKTEFERRFADFKKIENIV